MSVLKMLTKNGWSKISLEYQPAPETKSIAIPGFRNCHSHAFQYAMAGLAENHTDTSDDFWSWRNAMYSLALSVTPDDVESIATMLYSEMVSLGYSHVAEFHYLHHDKDGRSYSNPAEMSIRLMKAADTAGIRLTLVPVLYKNGGFGKQAKGDQRRFVFESSDQYLKFVDQVTMASKEFESVGVGIGVHSIRAAGKEEISDVIDNLKPEMPFHVHIAEQPLEVEECIEFYGARPVEWFCGEFEVDERFNLVHATHVTQPELESIANSGASVVICPTTEGNLGDGIFPLKQFMEMKGSWSIGTDSHVSLDPFEEFRLLDYGQRLTSNSRNTFGKYGVRTAIWKAFEGATSALGNSDSDEFAVLESDHPNITTAGEEDVLNSMIYSGAPIKRTLISSKLRTIEKEKIRSNYLTTLNRLRNL